MIGTKTSLYHRNIIKNINQVQRRAEKFMKLRLGFLHQQCKPFDKKLDQIKIHVKKYATLKQQQEKVIDNSKQIVKLSSDIMRLKDLTGYYDKILDEIKLVVFQIEDKNQKLRQYKRQLKDKASQTRKSLVLPFIRSSAFIQSISKSLQSPQKQIKKKMRIKPYLSTRTLPNQVDQNVSLRQELMNKISQFNNVDYMFKQCFQKKKAVINRMIGQLQSNLVKKKITFLKICNTINKQNSQEVTYEQFSELNHDQLISLIISFPEVAKKLMKQFENKRTRIAEILIQQGKLK